jgi:hypothetical protein
MVRPQLVIDPRRVRANVMDSGSVKVLRGCGIAPLGAENFGARLRAQEIGERFSVLRDESIEVDERGDPLRRSVRDTADNHAP